MADLYPLPTKGKLIGTPGQGTHAKAFNKAGGSDNWESENAVDIATPTGTPVYAVAAGTIGPQIGAQGGGRFAGLRVHLVTNGNEFFYAHLSKLTVKAGETVTAGEIIGYSGAADGVQHLHIASKVGNPVDLLLKAPTTTDTAPPPAQATAPAADTTPSQQPAPVVDQGPPVGQPDPATTQPDIAGTQPLLPQPGTIKDGTDASRLWNLISQQPDTSPDTLAYAQGVTTSSGG